MPRFHERPSPAHRLHSKLLATMLCFVSCVLAISSCSDSPRLEPRLGEGAWAAEVDDETLPEGYVPPTCPAFDASSPPPLPDVGWSTAPAGTIPGSFSVSSTGEAQYTMPIVVPPGRAGMEPSISVAYDSADGEGTLGMGFSIKGLSVVARCPRNVAQDEGVRGVRYDEGDALCLDGRRLVPVSTGADVDEYRTLPDTFTKVLAHYERWERRKGPKYLEAFTKSGRIVEYGRQASGKVLGREGVIRAWWVTRVRDRHGNAIDTTYRNETDEAKGYTVEHAPRRIDYTSYNGFGPTPSLPASRAVVFEYADKKQGRTLFSRGMALRRSWRLDHIKTFGPGETLVRDYRFHYGSGPATGRMLLDRVEECAADGVCKPPTRFDWLSGSGPGFDDFTTQVDVPRSDLGTAMAMDATGDGLDDIVISDVKTVLGSPHPVTAWTLAPNRRSRAPFHFLDPVVAAEENHVEVDLPMQPDVGTPIDYNHDGRMDLFLHDVQDDHTEWQILIAQADHTFTRASTGIYHPTGIGPADSVRLHNEANSAHLADVDGDGMSDLIQCFANGVDFTWTANLWKPDGPGFSPDAVPIPVLHWHPCHAEMHTTDIDSDGKVDLVVFHTVIATGSGATFGIEYDAIAFEAPGSWTVTPTGLSLVPTNGHVMFLDVNGDGLPDAVEAGFPDHRLRTFINTGDGFSPARNSLDSSLPDIGAEFFDKVAVPIDFNGDGRQDLLVPLRLPGEYPLWRVLQSTGEIGDGTFTLVDPHIPISVEMQDSGATLAYPWAPRPADLDGDGAQDLLIANGGKLHTFLSRLEEEDLLHTVTDGLNPLDPTDTDFSANVQIRYAHLMDFDTTEAPSTVPAESRTYLPRYDLDDDDCAYPNRCVVGSRRVVSRYWIGDGDKVRRSFEVAYRNGRYNRLGGGFLGFGERIIRDLDTGAGTLEKYDTTTFVPSLGVYPFAGQVVEELRWSPTSLEDDAIGAVEIVHRTTLPQVARTNGGATYYTVPILRREVRAEGEMAALGGRTLEAYVRETPETDLVVLGETLKTIGDYDEYGNTLDESASTEGIDYALRVTRKFDNDAGSWLIGQMRDETACSSSASIEQCRTTYRVYDGYGQVRYERFWTTDHDRETRLGVQYTYDGFGNVTGTIAQDTFGAPRATCTSYDNEGIFPYARGNAAGHVSLLRFDPGLGVQTQSVDPNGLVTYWRHDKLGRAWFERRPEGPATATTITRTKDGGPLHDRWNIKVETGTAGGRHDTVEYDSLGRAVRWWTAGVQTGATAPDRILQWIEFDDLGEHVARRSTPIHEHASPSLYRYDEYAYDGMGRVVSHTTPWHAVTRYEYRGRRVRTYGPGATTEVINDPFGRPVTITNADIATTEYTYAPFGGLAKVKGPGDATTVTERDAYGRVRSRVDPDRGAMEVHTSGYGETRYSIDALGRRVDFERDPLGRLTARYDADGTTRWTWDKADHGVGKLSQVDSPAGHGRAYTYDDRGRLDTSTLSLDGETFTTAVRYDEFGRVKRIEYPHEVGTPEFAVRHAYDPHGHLVTVANDIDGRPYWQETDADSVGRIHTEHFGDGADTVRRYDDEKNRVTSIETTKRGVTLQQLSYDYDDRLNLESRTDGLQGKTEHFLYDALDRLKFAYFDTPPLFYAETTYEPNGNIHYKPGVGSYTYDPQHPHAVQTAGSSWYGYDAVGNQRTRPGATIDYTAFDKPKLFTLDGGPETVALDYDGNQARIRKTAPDETTVYVDGLYERVTSAVTRDVAHRYYVHSSERPVAVVTRKAGALDRQAYLHVDHLGSVNVVVEDGAAPSVERRSYDAFGAKRAPVWGGTASPAPQKTTRGFTGHEGDDVLGLVNMNGRLYDPAIGRFLTPDRIVAKPLYGQSWNSYSYVLNNPLAYVDPTGWSEEDGGLGEDFPAGSYDFVDANGAYGTLIVVTAERERSQEPDERAAGADSGAYVPPVDVNVFGTSSGDAPEPTVSAIEQGPRNSAGDVALGIVDGTGAFAGGLAKSLLLNALTFGMYSGYESAKNAWNGYQEDGFVGAINAVNPLYQLARGGADAYLAIDDGDYRAAAAAATPVAIAAVGAVLGGVLGREALAAESAETGAAAQAARGAPKLLPQRSGPSGQISPGEVINRTPTQIEARAGELGLSPRGPAPAQGRGAYIDPQTGQQRILVHPNASPPHAHVNNPVGQRIGPNGQVVLPESTEAHLPIRLP